MRAMLRRLPGLGLSILAVWGLVAASRSTFTMDSGRLAVLRLSWSGRPERIETCRRLSTEELEDLPAHMRREVECEGRPARYEVRATAGARVLMADTVTGGGVRGDRAIHMLRDLVLPPGTHHLSVEVLRLDEVTDGTEVERDGEARGEDAELWRPGSEDRERRESEERRRQRLDRLPPVLRWDRQVLLRPGQVVLVSYDPIGRKLVGGP